MITAFPLANLLARMQVGLPHTVDFMLIACIVEPEPVSLQYQQALGLDQDIEYLVVGLVDHKLKDHMICFLTTF